LYFKNSERVNKEMCVVAKRIRAKCWFFVVIFLLVFGFVDFVFLLFSFLLFSFLGLYVFAKGLENVSMIEEVSGKELREGDWLVKDIQVGGKIIRANWDGLSLKDLDLLKDKNRVLIRQGLAFVPAFFIAFLGYAFFRDWFVGFLLGLA